MNVFRFPYVIPSALPLLLAAACDMPAASADPTAVDVGQTAAAISNDDNIPVALQPPAGEVLKLRFTGVGVQIYSCTATVTAGVTSYAFVLLAPEADLLSDDGRFRGNHFLGPHWQLRDGSKVAGTTVAKVASPDPDAIPWLLLSATSTDGPGLLADVQYVQRVHTSGGVAPATGCDADHVGTQVRIAYSAHYRFFHLHREHDGDRDGD